MLERQSDIQAQRCSTPINSIFSITPDLCSIVRLVDYVPRKLCCTFWFRSRCICFVVHHVLLRRNELRSCLRFKFKTKRIEQAIVPWRYRKCYHRACLVDCYILLCRFFLSFRDWNREWALHKRQQFICALLTCWNNSQSCREMVWYTYILYRRCCFSELCDVVVWLVGCVPRKVCSAFRCCFRCVLRYTFCWNGMNCIAY